MMRKLELTVDIIYIQYYNINYIYSIIVYTYIYTCLSRIS